MSTTPSDPSPRNASTWIILGCVALCAVIAVDVGFILKARQAQPTASSSAAVAPPPSASNLALRSPEVAQPPLDFALQRNLAVRPESANTQVFDEESEDDRAPARPAPRKHFATVEQAVAGSCSTSSVEGLSRQIIEQARCIDPKGLVELPKRPNLALGPHVFPYLQAKARDDLLRVLDAHPKRTMTVNSALRTVVQQYVVWRWSANQRCGVKLAATPGESNHEFGLALDIADESAWRAALEAERFKWLGADDRVHFDHQSQQRAPAVATDLLAFQKLWNKNHPADRLPENGRYDEAVERRIKTAPPDGFPKGPSCARKNGPGR